MSVPDCIDDHGVKRVVFVCPAPLTAALVHAAEKTFTTKSEYTRRAIIEKLRSDGFDPTRTAA